MSLFGRAALVATLTTALATLITGCGGGGGAASGGANSLPTANAPTTTPLTSQNDALGIADPSNDPLLSTLFADAGLSGQYVTPASSARLPQNVTPQGAGPSPFVAQIVGGTATIARTTGANASSGFLMTYRDSSGSCQCNFNGGQTNLPNPPGATIAASGWNSGNPYHTIASSTVVLIAFSGHGVAPVAGPYTYTVGPWANSSSTVTANSGSINTALTLGRESAPTVVENKNGSGTLLSITVSWAPLSGANEYFLNFLTTHGTGHTHVSGVAITPHTSITISASNLYTSTQYQVMLIASDYQWLNPILLSSAQTPTLPAQIDWSVAPLAAFTTP